MERYIGSMNTNITLRTAQAAEVAGVGYEGLRSWLKRGLLKDAGAIGKFYGRDTPAEVTDLKRWRWSSFGFSDLCSFRLAKLMFDAGLTWEAVEPIVGDLWRSHDVDSPETRFLAVFARSNEYTLYSKNTLAADVATDIIKAEWLTLIDLHELREDVMIRTRVAALRALAEDIDTTHISAKSGAALLTPEQAAQRIARFEQIAAEIRSLATEAEQGGGSYEQFEALLHRLHVDGKMADPSLVSTLAASFPDPPNPAP
jgi:hypothetical protein